MLAGGPVPVIELRAAVIIGSGSASFEMLRYLVEVLPVMVTPRWVHNRCQPIAIRDVLAYLVAALDVDGTGGEDGPQVLEIGGPDVLTYLDMMRTYAEVAGLRRGVILPVPVLSPSCRRCGSGSSRRCRPGSPGRWSRASSTRSWSTTTRPPR